MMDNFTLRFILAQMHLPDGRSPDDFLITVRAMHQQFMCGEFSQGYMAEQLGISRLDLIHLLDAMGLPATNV